LAEILAAGGQQREEECDPSEFFHGEITHEDPRLFKSTRSKLAALLAVPAPSGCDHHEPALLGYPMG
jgi:hypothetical protein